MKSIKNLSLIVVTVFAVVFSGCKYEEGPGISFRSKRDRVANEWKVTGYELNGSESDAMKNSFVSGDSIELVFIVTRNYSYAMNMAYVDGYTSPSGDKLLSPSATDLRGYQDVLAEFSVNNVFFKTLQQSGKWSFSDKYKKLNFGANGDLSYAEGGDTSIIKSDIIMLKNKMLKIEFKQGDDKHRITFEPKNKEIVK
ncbi:MAG: hypothetical protein R2852_08825 [Bacteroidia bacterium]